MKNKSKSNKFGGKVIASGGFGCVFNPALKCKGQAREKGKISKLMSKKHAINEYNEIQELKQHIDKIPNYKRYFLIDKFTICSPDYLDKSDLENFEKKCTALPKDNIKTSNINQSLDKLMLINMENGGIPVDDYIYNDGSFDKLYPLNLSLIDLLNNGILPMNKLNVFHCDVKDSNVLVKLIDGKPETRLIDWGLSTTYVPHIFQKFPNSWRNRPLQYNVPFSVIIFTDLFIKMYSKYLKNGGKRTYLDLKPFVLEYIYIWVKNRGSGHYKFINSVMYMLFSNEMQTVDEKTRIRIIETDFTLLMIANYIIEVLIHFTKFRDNGELNLREYLDNVFIKIVDVWGFIMIYFPLLELLFNNYHKLNNNQLSIFRQLKHIIIENCYNPRIKPINIVSLNSELQHLSKLIENEKSFSINGINSNNSLNNTFKKNNVTGLTFMPQSSTSSKSYFIKTKKSTAKKIKNLILVPNKTKKTLKNK